MSDSIVKIKHLKKYYGDICGVEDVSLELHEGEIYGFIGPNGAGKSTTIRTFMGLLNKNSGEILVNGEEFEPNNPSTKELIGYLPSEINLYGDMTIRDLLNYHESFYDRDISDNRKRLVKLFKIDESKKIDALSLGNLKKIGIVLALMHEPKILILDEPTSGLDPIMQGILHDLLKKEKEKGTTILYSSHVLSEVSNLCDKIGFIKNGKIIKEDLIENIMKNNITYLTISSDEIDKIKKDLKLEIKSEDDKEVTFINNLDSNSLINKLSKYNINKILIENISLEDLFVNYYK